MPEWRSGAPTGEHEDYNVKSLRHIACGAALAVTAMPATAATVDELMVEIQKMNQRHEQELKQLKSQINQLKRAQTKAAPVAEAEEAPAPTVSKRLDELEKKVADVDKKSKKRDDMVKRTVEEQKEKLQVHGFMSAYAVNSDKNVDFSNTGVEDNEQFRSDTMAGVQFDYKVNDTVDAVLQLTSNGYENYDIDAEWAFLRFKLQDNWMVRTGRLRSPTYMYSESMDVGYTYPWVRPPMETYVVGLGNYDGVDTIYSFNTGDWRHDVQFYVGTMDEDAQGITVKVRDRWGMSMTSSVGPWTLRGSYTLLPSLELNEYDPVSTYYASLGGRYDDGQWLAIAEVVDFGVDDASPILGNTNAYFTLGYRIGKFMPYASYAVTMTGEDDEDKAFDFYQGATRAGVIDAARNDAGTLALADAQYAANIGGGVAAATAARNAVLDAAGNLAAAAYDASAATATKADFNNGLYVAGLGQTLPGLEIMQEQKSITLGIRYDVLENVALKLESTYAYDFNGTKGVFSTGDYDQTREELGDSNQIVSFGVDSVF